MKIRAKITLLLSFVIAFVIFAIVAESIASSKNDVQVAAGKQRYLSFILVNEFSFSSATLTRLSRSYVATGDQKYWDQYFYLVNWRSGKINRPSNVNQELYPDEKISQVEIMKKLNFTVSELALLNQASGFSVDLINTETQAMETIKQGKFVKGPFQMNSSETTQEFALRILFDANYHAEVSKIGEPVKQFFVTLDNRTSTQLNKAGAQANFWINFAIVLQIIVGLIIAGVTLYIIKFLFKPLDTVVETMQAVDIGKGRLDLSYSLTESG